jgi:hypothetical protein
VLDLKLQYHGSSQFHVHQLHAGYEFAVLEADLQQRLTKGEPQVQLQARDGTWQTITLTNAFLVQLVCL